MAPTARFLTGFSKHGRHARLNLYLAAAGRLLGSGKPEDYSAGKGVPPGSGNVVILYAANAANVTIEGEGAIDGQGNLFYTGHETRSDRDA